ncbi:ead/Ea22-like family protein [Klebsiella pneumoniae]
MTNITELAQLRDRTVDYPYYLVECDCGKIYPSSELSGGEPMGDSGDYSDCYCPHCGEGEEHFAECADPETAWKAQQDKIDALVEALEKAQQERENWRTSFDNERFRADKLKAYIDDMEPIRAAAEKLVRCKGRYHSEQNYRALAALFGVKTPDLPPLEHENVHYADAAEMEIAALRQRIAELEREQEHLRPVGVMSEQAFHRLENRECRFIALWPRPGIFLPRKRPEDGVIVYARTAAAAGIKVETE